MALVAFITFLMTSIVMYQYFEDKDIEYIHGNVGCTVGIHSGVKACGIFFVEE